MWERNQGSGVWAGESDGEGSAVPERLKLAVIGALAEGVEDFSEFEGDYILALVESGGEQLRWEYAFRARSGLYRAVVVGRRGSNGDLELQAEFEGSVRGPRWAGRTSDGLGSRVSLEAVGRNGLVLAGTRWPATVLVVPLPVGSGQPWSFAHPVLAYPISGEPTGAELALMASSGGGSSSSSCGPCPDSVEVNVHPNAANTTRKSGDNYFRCYLEHAPAILKATPSGGPCDDLVWSSEEGDGCVEGQVSSPYQGDHCSATVNPSNDPEYEGQAQTVCVTISCCGTPLWKGLVEFCLLADSCPTGNCTLPPDLDNVGSGQGNPNGRTPGTVPRPGVGTGGSDPIDSTRTAGPSFASIDALGRLNLMLANPAGNDATFPVYFAWNSQTFMDRPEGYGWVGSFHRSLYTDTPNGDTNVWSLPPVGIRQKFRDKTIGGDYTTPPGGTSILIKLVDGWQERNTAGPMRWTYDADGILKTVDRGGTSWDVTQTTVNGFKLPGTVTARGGQQVSLQYNASAIFPRLESITDEGGRTTQLAYADRHLISINQPGMGTTQFGYDFNDLTSIMLPGGQRYTYTYDADHRVTGIATPNGGVTTMEYRSPTTTVRTDPCGTRTTLTHDGVLGLVSALQRSGQTWNYSFNQARFAGMTNPTGDSILIAYESAGNDALREKGRVADSGRRFTYTYDTGGLLKSIDDFCGQRTTLAWDAAGDRTDALSPGLGLVTYAYDSDGLVTGITNELGRPERNVLDGNGNRTGWVVPSGRRTSFTYNTYNQVAAVKTPLVLVTTYTRDQANRVTAVKNPANEQISYAYNAGGQLETTTDPLGAQTRNIYGADAALLAIKNPLQQRTSFAYDLCGRRIRSTDPLGHVTTTTYNALDLPVATLTPLLRRSTTVYDPSGRPIAAISPLGTAPPRSTTETARSPRGWTRPATAPATPTTWRGTAPPPGTRCWRSPRRSTRTARG